MKKPSQILIAADSSTEEIDHFITEVSSSLENLGVHCRIWSPNGSSTPEITDDLVIVIGGDGALMSLLRSLNHPQVPIFGVNFGRVGFLMNPKQDPADLVDTLLGGNFVEQRLPVLEASWTSSSTQKMGSAAGINDIVGVYIDEIFLNAYSGDGLVISTPAGSTAYSLAAGGPVVHPDVEGVIVTPLNAHRPVQFHSLQFPVVLPLDTTIRVVGEGVTKRPIRVVVDGESFSDIEELRVQARGDSVRLLRPVGHEYIQSLLTRIIGEGQARS